MATDGETPAQSAGPARAESPSSGIGMYTLGVTLDVPAGGFRFEWTRFGETKRVAVGLLDPLPADVAFYDVLRWEFASDEVVAGEFWRDSCNAWPASVRALLKRIRQRRPLADQALVIGVLPDADIGPAKAGKWIPLGFPPGDDPWRWLGRTVTDFARGLRENVVPADHPKRGQELVRQFMNLILRVDHPTPRPAPPRRPGRRLFDLEVDMDRTAECIRFTWFEPVEHRVFATGIVRCSPGREFTWLLSTTETEEKEVTRQGRDAVHLMVGRWIQRFPTNAATIATFLTKAAPGLLEPERRRLPAFERDEQIIPALVEGIALMAEGLQAPPDGFGFDSGFDAYERRAQRKEQKRAEEAARREANIRRLAEERRQRDIQENIARATAAARLVAAHKAVPAHSRPTAPGTPATLASRPPALVPPVAVTIRLPALTFQDTALSLPDLRNFALRERAALWWVSNQSDDLLCLPHCRIERLEYQVRTALRVLGPLRGRALLSDEVGLGKTIEAGLVLKELLTRGMVKRFLVLTLPSLVDQWAEELDDKFGLATATTNLPGSRDAAANFWRENPGIVASLHTLKQPAHLEIARQLQWDLLIVDEAHYLRNRDSQAWQAVNVLPRQFLLLLTATPVQNSLDELYNLVTLLMPGQLPTPRDFRTRFFDPKRPRQPREPEELRRLLGQVMIRNTRANAGINLPPRRAETVLFSPDAAEGTFWREWEAEFRAALGRLNAAQASLWGRLLLRAAGSSPAAWRSALKKFPDASAARAWRERAPLDGSWRRKCELIPPLARSTGGVVIFTEFLETQAALAEFLHGAGVAAFVINGATPAPERQPITERFHQNGGALVLTHSGTEGRNLQFCHRLANFDLPWNPMEIEQRIGRLHRLGQRHPVEIHNFVQAGTLQEHLLQILQEKLNLFELVVGETGLVLGERYSGDEFEEEVFRRWRESEGRVAEALGALGEELAAARDQYGEVKQLDATLFAHDYEST